MPPDSSWAAWPLQVIGAVIADQKFNIRLHRLTCTRFGYAQSSTNCPRVESNKLTLTQRSKRGRKAGMPLSSRPSGPPLIAIPLYQKKKSQNIRRNKARRLSMRGIFSLRHKKVIHWNYENMKRKHAIFKPCVRSCHRKLKDNDVVMVLWQPLEFRNALKNFIMLIVKLKAMLIILKIITGLNILGKF